MKSKYFKIEDFVPADIHSKYGETAWKFIDSRLVEDLETIREKLKRPLVINTWARGGKDQKNGFIPYYDKSIETLRLYNIIPTEQQMFGRGVKVLIDGTDATSLIQRINEFKDDLMYINRIKEDSGRRLVILEIVNE